MVAINNSSLGLTAPNNMKYKPAPLGSVFVNQPKALTAGGATQINPMTTGGHTAELPKITFETAAPAQPAATRPTLTDSYQQMKTTLGNAPRLQYQPIANSVGSLFSNQQPIKGLGADYFNTARNQMKENLRKEMFGPLGIAQDAASKEVAAGRAGSGVGKRVLEETVTAPYAAGLQDIESQILMKQMEEAARVEQANQQQDQFRQQILSSVYASDSSNALEAAKANTTLATKFAEIASDMAKYEQGQLSDEEMFNKKMEFDSLMAEIEANNQAQAALWETSQAALGVETWLPGYIDELKNSGMSYEEVRDLLVPMAKAGGGVNYQQIFNHLENAYGKPATANIKEFKY